jgi:hypothetical protein
MTTEFHDEMYSTYIWAERFGLPTRPTEAMLYWRGKYQPIEDEV